MQSDRNWLSIASTCNLSGYLGGYKFCHFYFILVIQHYYTLDTTTLIVEQLFGNKRPLQAESKSRKSLKGSWHLIWETFVNSEEIPSWQLKCHIHVDK